MAALVASPLASPLNSPRSAPSFQKGPAETSALVDGLLTAWEEQQSRSPAIDQCFRFHEPTSFPFPVIADTTPTIGTAPDDPCTNLSQGGEFSTLDFDVLFDGLGQTSLYSGHDYNLGFSGISEAHVFNDDLSTSRPACLETAYTEEKTKQEFVTPFGASWVEIETQNFQPMEVERPVHIPKSPFGVSANPTQTIKWDAGTHRSSFALQAEAPLQTAPPFSFGLSLEPNYTSSSIPFVSTILTPSADLHKCGETPMNQYYLHTSTSRKRRRLQELPHNKKQQYRDETGMVVGTELVLGNQKPLRQPLSQLDKALTKATRNVGACSSCRTSKKRCNRPEDPLYECCKSCLKSKVLSMPCFMAKIIDAQLFRDKPSPKHPRFNLRQTIFGSLVDIIQQSERQRPIIVTLTQDLGLQLLVILARYEPEPGECTHRTWKKDGQTRLLELPHYCIANMGDAQRNMLEYIANFRSAFLKHVLGRSNDITRGLFDQAQRFAAFNPDSTVSKALDLCAASRIIERDWRVCGGPPNLGIPLVSDDPNNPFYDFMPITPMMDAQLDQIVIQSFLVPIREALLKSLQEKMTSSSSTSSFFEIFLTIAVLLSHGEWLLGHSRRNALRVGSKTRYNYIPRAESYFHACNTLIAYWHHMCRGASLAEMDWTKESVKKWAGLDSEQAQYLDRLQRKIVQTELKSMMLQIRRENRYEEELYWCHQLFFANWRAGARTVEEAMTD